MTHFPFPWVSEADEAGRLGALGYGRVCLTVSPSEVSRGAESPRPSTFWVV